MIGREGIEVGKLILCVIAAVVLWVLIIGGIIFWFLVVPMVTQQMGVGI